MPTTVQRESTPQGEPPVACGQRFRGEKVNSSASAWGSPKRRYRHDVVLDASMPAAEGFRAVLVSLADTMTASWGRVGANADLASLHQFRVAVRRTRVVVREGSSVLATDRVIDAGKQFGRIGRLTGPVRDLDVFLLKWPETTAAFPSSVSQDLDAVRLLVEQRRASAWVELVDTSRTPGVGAIIGTWRSWLDGTSTDEAAVGTDAEDVDHAMLGTVVRRRIRRAHRSLVDAGRRIEPKTPADRVHDLRKDAKTLRYLIAAFGPLIADHPRRDFTRRLKALQDVLGEHQDAETQLDNLRLVAIDLQNAGTGIDTTLAIGRLMEVTDARRLNARTLFAERFATYDSDATNDALNDALQALKRTGKAPKNR
jgi:CHAD domain-containing protein